MTSLLQGQHLDLELCLVTLLFLSLFLLFGFLLFLHLDGLEELRVEGGQYTEDKVTYTLIRLDSSLENDFEDIRDSGHKNLEVIVIIG